VTVLTQRVREELLRRKADLAMYSCGVRRSELCRLKVSDIDSQRTVASNAAKAASIAGFL
jgi:integrase